MTRDARLAELKILVLEDETLVSMMLEDMLEELGCGVLGPFGSTAEALEKIATGDPIDLALLDVNLGGETAYAVAERLTELRVPFVFVSGYGVSGIEPRFAGVPVLAKPFQLPMLERVLHEAIIRFDKGGAAEGR